MSRTIKFAKAGRLDVLQFIERRYPPLGRPKSVEFSEAMWPKDTTR